MMRTPKEEAQIYLNAANELCAGKVLAVNCMQAQAWIFLAKIALGVPFMPPARSPIVWHDGVWVFADELAQVKRAVASNLLEEAKFYDGGAYSIKEETPASAEAPRSRCMDGASEQPSQAPAPRFDPAMAYSLRDQAVALLKQAEAIDGKGWRIEIGREGEKMFSTG